MLTHDGKCYRGNLRENSEDNSTSAKQNSPIVIQDDIGINWQTKNENLLIWSCWNKKWIWHPWLQENVTRRDNNNNSKSSDPNGLRRCVSRVLPPWQQPNHKKKRGVKGRPVPLNSWLQFFTVYRISKGLCKPWRTRKREEMKFDSNKIPPETGLAHTPPLQ